MADTLPNVRIPANTWVELYTETGITVGTVLRTQNVGVNDVSLITSATQPPDVDDAKQIIKRSQLLRNKPNSPGEWVYSGNSVGLLNVNIDASMPWDNNTPPSDYLIEVRKGNVPGSRTFLIWGVSSAITTTFTEVSDIGGIKAFPVVAEALEVVSTSADDALLGTGCRQVTVTTLDEDFIRQVQIVDMDGLTPVSLTGMHIRTRSLINAAGDRASITRGSNVGDITLQTVGGGTLYEKMLAGNGLTFSTHYTVPAGATALAVSVNPSTPKGEDALFRSQVILESGAKITGGIRPVYQSFAPFQPLSPTVAPAKSDAWFEASTSNPGPVNVSISYEILEIDNVS